MLNIISIHFPKNSLLSKEKKSDHELFDIFRKIDFLRLFKFILLQTIGDKIKLFEYILVQDLVFYIIIVLYTFLTVHF